MGGVEYVQKDCAKKYIRDMNISGMPVTPEEWDSGASYTLLAKGIRSFLRENSPMGYSANELYAMLSDIGYVHGFNALTISHTDVVESLNGLVKDEQIESKKLEGETSSETYYRAIN